MFLSVIVIARDGNWTPSNGDIYAVFLATVLLHGVCASVMSKIMGKYVGSLISQPYMAYAVALFTRTNIDIEHRLQTLFVVMNFILIAATIIALPIGARNHRNDAHFIFAQTGNTTTWPKGWAFMLAWLCPIWTIGTC